MEMGVRSGAGKSGPHASVSPVAQLALGTGLVQPESRVMTEALGNTGLGYR